MIGSNVVTTFAMIDLTVLSASIQFAPACRHRIIVCHACVHAFAYSFEFHPPTRCSDSETAIQVEACKGETNAASHRQTGAVRMRLYLRHAYQPFITATASNAGQRATRCCNKSRLKIESTTTL